MSIPAEDQSGQEASAPVAPPQDRRIFICYPRSALKDVEAFERALKESLDKLNRNYRIFRDKGPDDAERIVAGTPWKQYLLQKLDDSRCCLLVLVPAIFQSTECADEVEHFRKEIEADPKRFFYPIVFIPLTGEDSIEAQVKAENRLATAIKDLDYDDFPKSRADAETTDYIARVNAIAKAIHNRFSSRAPEAGAPSSTPFSGRGAAVAARPRWRSLYSLIAAAAVLAVAALLLWTFIPKPRTEMAVTPVTAPVELVLSTPTFAAPYDGAERLEPLGPSMVQAGKDGIAGIGEGESEDRGWYLIEFANGDKRYLPKDSIPVWTAADRNLEIVRPINAFAQPSKDSAAAGTLAPGDLQKATQYGEVREASIAGEKWFRVPRREGADLFFPESQPGHDLVIWAPFPGCLKVKADGVWSSKDPVGGDDFNSFIKGQLIGKGNTIYVAQIDGEEWFRFTESEGAAFGYLKAQNVDKTECGAT
jgi:hypothetical protein